MTEWEAYVDGSYYNHKVGYGAILIHKNKIKNELFGSVPKEFSHSRQVGGELLLSFKWLNGVKRRYTRNNYKF